MGVERDGVPGEDPDVEHADGVVFEEQNVVVGGGETGVEVTGPWPRRIVRVWSLQRGHAGDYRDGSRGF